MSTPTIAQLEQAVTISEQIEKLQTELARLVGSSSSVAALKAALVSPTEKTGKRKMSPETIAKMKAAQQARWAKKNGAQLVAVQSSPIKKTPKKGKRTMSPETIAKMKAAQQARWAKKKAAK